MEGSSLPIEEIFPAYRKAMKETYGQSFVAALLVHAQGNLNEAEALGVFDDFSKALYEQKTEGVGEETYAKAADRQQLVDALQPDINAFLNTVAPKVAQGKEVFYSAMTVLLEATRDPVAGNMIGANPYDQPLQRILAEGLVSIPDVNVEYPLYWEPQAKSWVLFSPAWLAAASGEVHVFLPANVSAQSTFWYTQLAQLQSHPVITKITVHSPTDNATNQVNALQNSGDSNTESYEQATENILAGSMSWEHIDVSRADSDVNLSGEVGSEEEEEEEEGRIEEKKKRKKRIWPWWRKKKKRKEWPRFLIFAIRWKRKIKKRRRPRPKPLDFDLPPDVAYPDPVPPPSSDLVPPTPPPKKKKKVKQHYAFGKKGKAVHLNKAARLRLANKKAGKKHKTARRYKTL